MCYSTKMDDTLVVDFITSDLHFGHLNIIDFCDRPFETVEQMNAGIIAQWNSVVRPLDNVLVVGDVCMGKLDETLPLVNKLNGHKVLIPGNHDRCSFEAQRKPGQQERWIARYLDECGFEQVWLPDVRALDRPHLVTLAGYEFAVSHYPYQGDKHDGDRYTAFRPTDKGKWLIHGHIHDLWRQNGRQVNVGLDAWGGWPVSAEEIVGLRRAGVCDLKKLPWKAPLV